MCILVWRGGAGELDNACLQLGGRETGRARGKTGSGRTGSETARGGARSGAGKDRGGFAS